MPSPVIPITTHVERALALFVEQFRCSPRLHALASALVRPLQECEDQAALLAVERFLAAADGAQLDGLGAIVEEPRLGRDDSDYRDALFLTVFVNVSKGSPDQVSEFAKAITGATMLTYEEVHPAKVRLTFNGAPPSAALTDKILRFLPVGVGLELVSSTEPNPFNFVAESGPQFGGHLGEIGNDAGAGVFVDG